MYDLQSTLMKLTIDIWICTLYTKLPVQTTFMLKQFKNPLQEEMAQHHDHHAPSSLTQPT